ncbi:uncharacterized protein LOC128123699 [Peromyscus californicus insignis]|uniref:uncharacterized protein LOC128123699 n=1 Tax=Peromyscus californicus insignis TaxID=564181 RepID=UPI0022A7DFEE|nr:uncharacterized protein LOC128123699 [Peromyscus californicus insignis]
MDIRNCEEQLEVEAMLGPYEEVAKKPSRLSQVHSSRPFETLGGSRIDQLSAGRGQHSEGQEFPSSFPTSPSTKSWESGKKAPSARCWRLQPPRGLRSDHRTALPGPRTWSACLLRRGCGCPRTLVVPASDDVGQIHLNALHHGGQGFGRKPFSSPISILDHGTMGHGAQAANPGALTSEHSCLSFTLVSIQERPSARDLVGLPVEGRLWMSPDPSAPCFG